MNVLVQIYDSQTIICKKIAKYPKNHCSSLSRSGKQQRLFTLCYCFANSRTTL